MSQYFKTLKSAMQCVLDSLLPLRHNSTTSSPSSSNTPPGSPPSPQFSKFPELPREIRHQIYVLAAPTEIISLSKDFSSPREGEGVRIPAIFHVCRESREIARMVYRRGFWRGFCRRFEIGGEG